MRSMTVNVFNMLRHCKCHVWTKQLYHMNYVKVCQKHDRNIPVEISSSQFCTSIYVIQFHTFCVF